MIGKRALVAAAQIADTDDALNFAHKFSVAARLIETDLELKRMLQTVKFAFLNRACELACVPLHQRTVETSNGLETAWYTWRVEVPTDPLQAIYHDFKDGSWGPVNDPILGYVDTLIENEARSRAIGW